MDGKNLRRRQDLVMARIQDEARGHVVTAGYREKLILVRELRSSKSPPHRVERLDEKWYVIDT